MNVRVQFLRRRFNKQVDSHIALSMEIIEACVDSNSVRRFLRRSLLRRLNDIKRDALVTMAELEDARSNTVSDSVADFNSSHGNAENL